jgi:hypothetical protein
LTCGCKSSIMDSAIHIIVSIPRHLHRAPTREHRIAGMAPPCRRTPTTRRASVTAYTCGCSSSWRSVAAHQARAQSRPAFGICLICVRLIVLHCQSLEKGGQE